MKQVEQQLQHLEQQGMKRFLRPISSSQGPEVVLEGKPYLLLCSNNYLGLANHPALIEASCRASRDFGVGSGASRLVSGSMSLHHQLEEAVAAFKETEAALVFNNGVAANIGILQGLTGPGDQIFSDELNHASIVDGCRLSGAEVHVYPHCDLAALEERLHQAARHRRGRWLIVTDGIFSMDGDLAPLPELVALKERYDAWLMVDDAHGGGVLGKRGRGSAEMLGCMDGIDLHMGTFGKAFGSFGAYVATARPLVDLLINRARSFIFSTSLPPAVLGTNLAALELVDSEEGVQRRKRLQQNRQLFSPMLRQAGLDLCGSCSQIVPILTRDPQPTMRLAQQLFERGIFLSGIRPPTVPTGTCRLRATLMADHSQEQIRQAAELIIDLIGKSAQ